MSEPAKRVLALDVDLGRITAVHSTLGVIHHNAPFDGGLDMPIPDTDVVLMEIAGPIMHHEESHTYRKWLVFNAAFIGHVNTLLAFENPDACVLVSPSTDWTMGYTEVKRQAVAGIYPLKHKTVKGKKVPIYAEAHDIRECRAMLYFHRVAPQKWRPLDQYLKELCK